MLQVQDISAKYGDMQVLFGVSLAVAEGEIVALVGSNAAGKSTLIKTICGVVSPSGGCVRFCGQDISRLSPGQIVDLGLVLVPEGRRLFPFMTVEENLELGSFTPRGKARRRETLDEVYHLFPILKDRRGQQAGSLSGGEQQMCAIARGLMGRPKLLMLDEPSLGLAPIVVKEVFQVVRSLNQQGVTILLVELNVQHSLRLASRGYVLEHGRVALQGTGVELLEKPHLKKAYLGL